jgi:transglutaminase-like putative cysteine protease
MGLAFVFKLSVYALTGFVGLALGLAEYGPIPFVSLPVTIFSYWWCEVGTKHGRSGGGGLGEIPARVLGFLALLAASFEFFGNSPESKLLAGIHLMVYLTWVVLLQQKSIYRYWLLMTLGMMHVAVGSVLTNSTWYGLCMMVYLFGAVWTLSVFSLYRAAQEFAAVEPDGETPMVRDPSSTVTGHVFNAVRFEDNAHWISMRLVSGVSMTSLAGLFVGVAFFVLIPRVWVGTALGISDEALPAALRRNVTGLASEIRLGDMGPILESNDPVLKLRMYDNQTDARIDPQLYAQSLGLREPLFAGTILTAYSEGRWRPERELMLPQRLEALPTDVKPAVGSTVRQEIRLERIGTNVLPCIGRAVAMRDPEGFRCGSLRTDSLVVRRHWFEILPGAVDYIAYSEIPSSNIPNRPPLAFGFKEQANRYLQRCRDVPNGLDRLQALARELVQNEQRKTPLTLTDAQKAGVIESYLRDSGGFKYSLSAAVVDQTADPVEDFLFSRRAGHCQYFASALGLMLRSVGIPARLVTGFKGGEELADGSLNVEKRYAHVWVEAWIEVESQRWFKNDAKWVTFDATPEAGRAESVTAIGTKRNLWTIMAAKLVGIWESNVLDISYDRQDSVIYQPIRDVYGVLVQFLRDFWHSPRTTLFSVLAFLVDPRNWMTVPGGIVLTALVGLLWLGRRKSRWLGFLGTWIWRRTPTGGTQTPRRLVAFYERFARLMQSHGRTRELDQTQGEFVREVARDLSGRLPDSVRAGGLQLIGELFYRVRFGAVELTDREEQSVNEMLGQLERDLSASTNRQPPKTLPDR